MGAAEPVVDVIDGQRFERSHSVGCPICGNAARKPRRISVSFGLTAVVGECPGCRVAFQTLRPSAEASLAYMNWRWKSSDAYVADRQAQLERAAQQVRYLRGHVTPKLRIADFGAGAGSFVRAALDEGWQAVGIEQSESAIARAKEFYGIELQRSLGSEKFDVITLWDVIEHLRDLNGTLTMLTDHLEEGGMLVVETGNYESWQRLAGGNKWDLYLFDHQFYFSPASLEHVLNSAGCDDFRLLDTNRDRPPLNPKTVARFPVSVSRGWAAWALAKARWPHHGNINVMVAFAAKTGRKHST